MNTNNSYTNIQLVKKRERLMALLERKKNGKQSMKERIELKKLNAHCYKKLFKNSGQKIKVLNESYSDSRHKKRRLCCGQERRKSFHHSCTKNKIGPGNAELSDFRSEVSSEKHNHVLPYVKKLCDYWNRCQNAVFFDGQERLLKVVLFVSSLLDNVRKPILVIADSSALSLWEDEFAKWSKLTNVVTYKGNKDARVAIRSLKFYSDNESIQFQVLLSSPDFIVEDLEMLDRIKWELIVVDECQRPEISTHFSKIKMLVAHMKLLTVSAEKVETRQSYRNILSLLDCKQEEIPTHADMETNDSIHAMKERLSPFIVFHCKFYTPEFEEYWVPVHLSSMQIEQYCSILVSNLESLSSCLRDNTSLRDILTQTQKCCDHPYLVDPALRNSAKKLASVNPLDADINVSGKLKLLDKILLEIKQCGKRVLVLFQSAVSSEKISTGHFLDDLVHQRFGPNSYVHIPWKILSKSIREKKKELIELFNRVESEAFICLCDYRACRSSIRLSCVDVVILFNGDWNPSNDIKALQRITIESHCERISVLRLYSSFTVEEKALIFSKQGKSVDSCLSSSVCHRLLAWGTSYLFTELQSCTTSKSQSFIDDLVQELSSLFRNTSGKTGPTNHSLISNPHLLNGAYSGSILLLGETEAHTKENYLDENYLMENGPSLFWSKLVKESQYRPKNLCNRLSRRVQTSTQNDCIRFEGENRNDATSYFFVRTKSRSKRKVHSKFAQGKRAGAHARAGGHQSFGMLPTTNQGEIERESTHIPDSVASDSRTNEVQQCQNNQLPHISSSMPLEMETERIQKEREQFTKLHQEKNLVLRSECEREISEIRKKYDSLIEESELSLKIQMKNVDEFYKIVNANKIFAEIWAENCDDTLFLKRTEKETSSLRVLEIPVSSTATKPVNASVSTTYLSVHNLGMSGLRAPAPHLRSSRSFHLPFHNRPTTHEPFLEPLPTQPSPKTVPCIQTESKYHVNQVNRDLHMEFDRFYDMGGPSLPFLDSDHSIY